MKVSQRGIDFIKGKEGLRLKAYSLNDGRYSIAYGNTFYEDGKAVGWNDSITREYAEVLFMTILERFENDLSGLISAPLTQSQWDALLSYCYNRGINNFASSTLRKMVNANPNNPAIADQFIIEWGSNANYKKALQDRRKQEAELYFSESSGSMSNNLWLAGLGIFFLIIIINQDNEQE